MDAIVAIASVTGLGPEHRGRVVVSGSHGGVYPAYLAVRVGARAAILNDAGIGRDRAGVAVIDYCQAFGMPAATVSHSSARIGDADDMMERGRISFVNAAAERLGCRVEGTCAACAELMTRASPRNLTPPAFGEGRYTLRADPGDTMVVAVDSASLVRPEDQGAIVVTGSHGGLLGGKPEAALRVDALAALFNDAGVGVDQAGIGRLAALATRGIAAATVAADSARIGDARSTFADGRISHVNPVAARYGAVVGMPAREFVDHVIRARHASRSVGAA